MKKLLIPLFALISIYSQAAGLPAQYKDRVYGFEFRLVNGPNGPLYVGVKEVTQGQWKEVTGRKTSPSHFRKGDEYPVENVTFDDVRKFLQKLKEKSGGGYRLPSAAEWTAASDAENHENTEDICLKANLYDETSRKINGFGNKSYACEDKYPYTAPAGSFEPNNFGLYDMLGNVAEWCCDGKEAASGTGGAGYCEEAAKSSEHGVAGGNFSDGPDEMNGLIHIRSNGTKFGGLGFRLAIDPENMVKTESPGD